MRPFALASLLLCLAAGAAPAMPSSDAPLLRWVDMPVRWAVIGEAPGMAPARAERAMQAAFDTWATVPGTRVVFERVADPADAQIVVEFVHGALSDGSDAFGLTTWASTATSGRLLAAPIELNARDYAWGDAAPDRADLQAVLTHELGHALGLPHSDDPDSTMYERAPVGDLRWRTLTADDMRELAARYADPDAPPVDYARVAPPPEPAPLPAPAPRATAPATERVPELVGAEPFERGCDTTNGPAGTAAWLLALGLATLRRRRHTWRNPHGRPTNGEVRRAVSGQLSALSCQPGSRRRAPFGSPGRSRRAVAQGCASRSTRRG